MTMQHQPLVEKRSQNPAVKRAVIGVQRLLRRADQLDARAALLSHAGDDIARRAALVREQAEQLERIVQRKLKRRE
ncbi:MAG: hypothetical protein M0R28_05900 [Pigmentiphaga sp.]|nr:hypothetical protein [Pigmentiphaga sp.]